MHLRWLWIGLFLCSAEFSFSQFTVMSYNVENYFSTGSSSHFYDKRDAIAKVITSVQGWNPPAIVALQEVENRECLEALQRKLKYLHYDFVHYESPDPRGIDVALLYQPEFFDTISTHPIAVHLGQHATRDILYVQGQILPQHDTIHLFVCHLPSQLNGTASTRWKREKVFQILRTELHNILEKDSEARIIVLGDMNCSPEDNLPPLINKALVAKKNGQGTHKHKGIWTCLDQIYVSPSMNEGSHMEIYDADWLLEEDLTYLGKKPKRCQKTLYKWQNGYSDHLPVICSFPTYAQ